MRKRAPLFIISIILVLLHCTDTCALTVFGGHRQHAANEHCKPWIRGCFHFQVPSFNLGPCLAPLALTVHGCVCSIMDRYYKKDMTLDEGKELLRKCIKVHTHATTPRTPPPHTAALHCIVALPFLIILWSCTGGSNSFLIEHAKIQS